MALVEKAAFRLVDLLGERLGERHRGHHVREKFALVGDFRGGGLRLRGGRVVYLAADGVLARPADGGEHVLDHPLLELAGVGHAGTHDEAVEVGFADGDHRLLAALGIDRDLAGHFGLAFHHVIGVDDLVAMRGDGHLGVLVSENLAHVVCDEPHLLGLVKGHADVGAVEDAVAELDGGSRRGVELVRLWGVFDRGGDVFGGQRV